MSGWDEIGHRYTLWVMHINPVGRTQYEAIRERIQFLCALIRQDSSPDAASIKAILEEILEDFPPEEE